MDEEVKIKLQIISQRARISKNFPSVLKDTGLPFEEALAIYMMRNAQKYVYAYYENAVTDFLRNSDFVQLMNDTARRGVQIHIVEVKSGSDNTPTRIHGINVQAISDLIVKRKHAEKAHFIIADDKMFGMRYDANGDKWMASFESRRTVRALKEYFEECTK